MADMAVGVDFVEDTVGVVVDTVVGDIAVEVDGMVVVAVVGVVFYDYVIQLLQSRE